MPDPTLTSTKTKALKLGETLTLIGTNFADDPALTKVFRRASGASEWTAITAANVTFTSATAISITLAVADGWAGGLNDIGVCDSVGTTPVATLAQVVSFYTAATDDKTKRVAGAIIEAFVGGRKLGDFWDAQTLTKILEKNDFYSQHSTAPVITMVTKDGFELDLPLLQWSPENVALAFGSKSDLTPDADGHIHLTGGGESTIDDVCVMLHLPWCEGFEAWFGFYKAQVSSEGDITFDKENPSKLPLKLTALQDTSRAAGDQIWFLDIYPIS